MHLLLSTEEMREADRQTIAAGTTGFQLMTRAGAAIADAVQGVIEPGGRILVVCGPGNNGGDGFLAASVLRERGYQVRLALLGTMERLVGDAKLAAEQWRGTVLPLEQIEPADSDLVIDALFGAGLKRELEGAARYAVNAMNASGRPVLAVDIPSGVDGNTGRVRGAAVHAARTVTFAARKPGHLLLPGRAYAGEVRVADIGISQGTLRDVGTARTFANGPSVWLAKFPRPGIDAHKYQRGHTLVVSGGATRTGAARLAARGALRAGAGLVTVAAPPEALGVLAAQLTAIMIRGCDGADGLKAVLGDPRFNALLLGPALGIHAVTRAMVSVAVEAGRALVLDADALTSFEGMAGDLHHAFSSVPAVLTPHDGEFHRLFKGQAEILECSSKLDRARSAAVFTRAVMVLKGPDTVIAAPDGRAAINENGTPYLATAGSGDVLAGIVAGLIAQGMPAFEAACAGVWLHAEAGACIGPGLIAEDIPELLPRVLKRLFR